MRRVTITPASAIGVILSAMLAGCTALPKSGPDDADIRRGATVYYPSGNKKPLTDYVLVDVTERVLTYLPNSPKSALSGSFGATRKGPPAFPLGIGDKVEVTLFESSAGGLFVPAEAGTRPGNFVTLPNQTIGTTGTISVPYAGLIKASGRTAAEVQSDIEEKLADRAIEPQAVVNLIESRSGQVSVLGDVATPAKLEINPGGERVLDVISRAGGINTPSVETNITLQRNGTTATVAFDLLLEKPKENVFVYPGDIVFAARDRRTYLAFGASGLNGRIDFENSDLSLAEAVGKAGGLLDARADPGEIFVYRLVAPEILSRMGTPVSAKSGPGFPVIFRLNLRDPSAYFLAQQFRMHDKDILYVSNSDSTEVLKFLNLISSATGGVSGPAADIATVKNAF